MNMLGITIVELLVTLSISSLILIGMVSANFAIHKNDRDVTQRRYLMIQALALRQLIVNEVNKSVGTGDNVGICLNNTSNIQNYICFKQPPNWVCYTRLNSAGTAVGSRLYQCSSAIVTTTSAGNDPYSCPAGAGLAACTTAGQWIGTLATDVFSGAGVWPSFGVSGFTMPIVVRTDPTIAESLTNPELRISISAFPEGHSY